MIQLIIIADDFTGGLDTGVQFAGRGIRTRVVTDPEVDYAVAADGCQVLVIVAETRHITPFEAYNTVYRIVRKSMALGIPHLYKKTDSGLRGNIGAELAAVLDASHEPSLAFMPSMPGIGRITRNGIHYIDGTPVSESVFGSDPFEPVRESDVSRLIALQTSTSTWHATPESIPDEKGIIIMDAETDQDLRLAGENLAAQGRLHTMAGCAGFASVLPELLGLNICENPQLPVLDPGLFVLCGSVNPITQCQLDYAEQSGFTRVHILPEQKLNPDYFNSDEGSATLRQWRALSKDTPWLILDANDADASNAESAHYAEAQGMSTEDIRSCISGTLGKILPSVVDQQDNRSLLITGGDTLLQCMNHMHVTQMEPLLEVFPGIVLSSFEVGGRSRYVITKSGGFGGKTLLCDLKNLIEQQQRSI